MAKKYTNADVKSLKRDEIFELLKENNIEFDKEQSLFTLRSLLLDVEAPEEKPEETPEEKPEKTPEEKPEEAPEEKPEETPEEKPEEAPEEAPEEKPEEKPEENNQNAMHAAFQNELSKRMATFGRAKQSVFSIELARRQGKVTGKLSFAEELKLRQSKVRR